MSTTRKRTRRAVARRPPTGRRLAAIDRRLLIRLRKTKLFPGAQVHIPERLVLSVGGRVGFGSTDASGGGPDGSGATDLDVYGKYLLNADNVRPGTFEAFAHDYRADLAEMVRATYGLDVSEETMTLKVRFGFTQKQIGAED